MKSESFAENPAKFNRFSFLLMLLLKKQLKTKINMEMEWKILQGNFAS
jgi:hypothetical protein